MPYVSSVTLAFEDAKIQFQEMTKTISQIGNSPALIFDDEMMELFRLKIGDRIDLSVVPEPVRSF
jgi:hypothetical protein